MIGELSSDEVLERRRRGAPFGNLLGTRKASHLTRERRKKERAGNVQICVFTTI